MHGELSAHQDREHSQLSLGLNYVPTDVLSKTNQYLAQKVGKKGRDRKRDGARLTYAY